MSARPFRLAALAGALGLLCALQLFCLLRAPAVHAPARIELRLRPGEALPLGRDELAAPQAGQLLLRRDLAGRWWLRSDGAGPFLLERGRTSRRSGSIVPATGQRFQLGATSFTVDAASDRDLAFGDGLHRWHYDGALLRRDGQALAPCPDDRLGPRLAAAWNRRVPPALALARPLDFGGNLICDNRLGVPGLPPASASIARANGVLLLAASNGADHPSLLVDGATDLARRDEVMDGVTALVAGRTRLLVSFDGDVMRLRPASHVTLFAAPEAKLPPQLAWHWKERDPWALPAPAGWLLALGAGASGAALLWFVRRREAFAPRTHAASGALLLAAGLAALLLQRSDAPPGHGVSMLLSWAALWHLLLAPNRRGLATATAVLLLAVGLLFQLELGLGAMESSWLRHFQKSAALLAIGAGVAASVRMPGVRLRQASIERLLLALATVALAALVLQVAYGDETGVFGVQPVELAKLALTVLTAHCLALGLGSNEGSGAIARWLRLSAPALLFLALLGLALVQVDDYSPLILLLVWSGAMLLAWSLASGRRLASSALAALACLAVLGVAGLRSAGAADLPHWSFYADRFQVWLDPLTHPHTGQQLLMAARAIADGGWWGADRLLGLASLGQQAGAVLRIPEIEDDFAVSFFLNRHGLAAGLALWTLQALFLAGLVRGAVEAWSASGRRRDFRQAWLARFHCFFLCGGAAFVFGHLLLSWGTNLAIFPVMGQPMSFLSAGGSHLLFFILPLLAAASAGAQSLEEISSCRSMSNMK
jgi:cell division protein FtsW